MLVLNVISPRINCRLVRRGKGGKRDYFSSKLFCYKWKGAYIFLVYMVHAGVLLDEVVTLVQLFFLVRVAFSTKYVHIYLL